jgi:hypothetical protein
MYANADITIYNKYYDMATRLDKWKRTQLKGVFWDNVKAANVNKSGMESADGVSVHIPFSLSNGYVEPKLFTGLVDTWTLQMGDKICLGLIETDYTKITDLEKQHSNVHGITKVDRKDFGSQHMRHWEVGGA